MKVDLPNYPYTKLSRYHTTTAFSSPRWSKDCVVIVVRRFNKINYLELNVLKFGANWVTLKIKYEETLNNTKGSFYYGKTFYFLDNCRNGITYCPKRSLVKTYFDGRNEEIIFSPDEHLVTTYLFEPPSRFEERQKGLEQKLHFVTAGPSSTKWE